MSLRERLKRKPILLAPGVYDSLGALLAEQAGFEALYLSGAGIAYTRLGRPDVGLVTASASSCRSSSTPTPATATRSTSRARCACSSVPEEARSRSSSKTR
jgi:hypothetical protein